ncbi:MAG: hypothetical protein ABFC84_18895 [Veillonellales bacterium]
MGLKNCPECGRLFVDNLTGMCIDCYKQVEEDELTVANYLREVRKASLEQIHEATGVKEKIILRMIRRGRITSDFYVTYPCETCGAPIHEGRVCPACSKNILDQVHADKEKPPQKNKLNTLNAERMYQERVRNKN